VVCFGPAAAWRAAFGNLIGYLFGTLDPGSLFGLLGNVLLLLCLWQWWNGYGVVEGVGF
jgi:energy-coupling factor transport system substrate-specific component